jgi:hypothetical protein
VSARDQDGIELPAIIVVDESDGPAEFITSWRASWIVETALQAAGERLAVQVSAGGGGDLLSRRTPDARAQR